MSNAGAVAWSRYQEAWDAVDADIAGMTELSKTWLIKENLQRLADIKTQLPLLRKNQEAFMHLAASRQKDAVMLAGNQFSDVCTANTKIIKASLDAMAAAQRKMIDDSWTSLSALQASLLKTQWEAAIAAIVAGILVAFWVSRSITSPPRAFLRAPKRFLKAISPALRCTFLPATNSATYPVR